MSDTGFKAAQMHIESDGLTVDLGNQGVGGKEQWKFATAQDATDFFDAVKADFGSLSDRGAMVNAAVETIAEDLGGMQIRNGNISTKYEARQIKLMGEDLNIVDMGNHRVGGKERYEFADQATAQKFIDEIRDAFGVEAKAGKLVDEFIFQVSGGAGISGSQTFVSKDDFVTYIAEEFDGDQVRNGKVSEGFSGGGRLVGDGTDVQLGPKGVGGKEIWDFDDAATAQAFLDTLSDVFA